MHALRDGPALDRIMRLRGATNEQVAAFAQGKGLRATARWIADIRKGTPPGRELAKALIDWSDGELTLDDLLGDAQAEVKEPPTEAA